MVDFVVLTVQKLIIFESQQIGSGQAAANQLPN